jgi:6,7-dimethyl-8-ribityllumazine synthase
MSTQNRTLSDYDLKSVPTGKGKKIAVVVSQWNEDITHRLCCGACDTLKAKEVREEDISIHFVPGSFELVYACSRIAKVERPDAIVAIGSVVRGETPHFDYVCQAVTQGITQLNVEGDIPIIFCLLTTNTMQQAYERAGGIHGHKGIECAMAALQMADSKLKL